MKLLVTGGAGFIGSHLVDALIERGFGVRVIDNLSGGKKERVNPMAEFVEGDIRDFEAVKKVMEGVNYVFHLAALPRVQVSIQNPKETNDVNVGGTLNLLVAAKDSGVKKFIYSASSSAYGDQDKMPLNEEMKANPISPYGLQKYVGELNCSIFSRIYGLKTASLRYFNVYGPRFDADSPYSLVIGRFLKQRKEGKPMTIVPDGEQTRDFTHVKDVVMANILAMESDKVGNGEVLNVGAGKNYSINRIADIIGGPKVYIEPRLEPRHTLADNKKAGELLGWQPTVSLEEGIEELKKEWLS
ncbi:SDR family oxidoreductase [Candidatus Parcubacteria bacterium]|nr:MAG: SDR family oxidoreductase [Candidatus Parcubacteria bacterium]